METSQKTNIREFDRKYKFDMSFLSRCLTTGRLIDGIETLSQYKKRVRSELASYYAANCLLRRRSPYTEAIDLGLSVRSVQRYWKEFPLADNLLDLMYHIQITSYE